jgi:hypothetical protein
MDQKDNATIWKQRFENRRNKLTPMFTDAQKYYDIMYAVQNTKSMSPWKSKVYVPILASKAWDLISRMSDVVPYFNVSAKNELEIDESGNYAKPDTTKEREARIEAKLHEDYSCGHEEPMKLKVFDPLVDAVVAGTGYAYAPWVFEEKESRARQFDDMGNMDNQNVVVKKTKEGHNEFEGVNFFNVFPADGPSFSKIPYLIVRGHKPLVDMKASGLYQNLEKVNTDVRLNEYQLFNQSRNRVVNEQDSTWVDDTVDTVTYYECYERTEKGIELTTYAEGNAPENSWVEIRPTSVPYWHNMYPVIPFYARRKSYSPFGESLFENNRTLQSATNDLFNHYLDNWNLSIESMLMYEDGTLTNDFVIEPGGEITFTGEPPKQFKFPEPNPAQLSVVMNVLEKGVENATFSQYASGVPNSANDKTQGTAYGVKTITEAATTKIGFFRDNFKQSMKTLGRVWLSNLQQFSDVPSEVTRTVNGRPQPDIVMPSDYQGELEVDIDDDSMTPLTKQERRDMASALTQDILGLQKAAIQQYEIFRDPKDIPRLNFLEMIDEKFELYSQKDTARFLLPNDIQIPQPQPEQPKYKDTPEGVLMDNISSKIDKLQPDVQAQLEEKAGLQPSAMHDTTMTNDAIKMGAEQAQIENQPIGGIDGNTTGQGAQTAPSPTQ